MIKLIIMYVFFSPAELEAYLSRVSNFTKIEYEILVALTTLIAYSGEYAPAEYYIGFPVKNRLLPTEIVSLPKEFSKFKDYIEENNVEDIRIGIKEKSGSKFIIPLQIKRVDLKVITNTDLMLDFLKKIKNKYSVSKTRLVILYENISLSRSRKSGKYRITFPKIEEWFAQNDFPFPEIILIHLRNNKRREIAFYQFWPRMDSPSREKIFTMSEVKSFVRNKSH